MKRRNIEKVSLGKDLKAMKGKKEAKTMKDTRSKGRKEGEGNESQ